MDKINISQMIQQLKETKETYIQLLNDRELNGEEIINGLFDKITLYNDVEDQISSSSKLINDLNRGMKAAYKEGIEYGDQVKAELMSARETFRNITDENKRRRMYIRLEIIKYKLI